MTIAELILEYLKVLTWPVVILVLFLTYRKAILTLLPKSKIKISVFGIAVEVSEMDLSNAAARNFELLGEGLKGQSQLKQQKLLHFLSKEGQIPFPDNLRDKEEREQVVRPVMNAGLVMTVPRRAHLLEAEGLELTPLGKMLMKS